MFEFFFENIFLFKKNKMIFLFKKIFLKLTHENNLKIHKKIIKKINFFTNIFGVFETHL